MRVSSALEAGTVWVNQYNVLNNNVPFGGKRQSGIGVCCILLLDDRLITQLAFCISGRELGSYALDEYTSVKAVHWNFGEKLDWPLF
jgi:aldehyde dehydrogenase (NAD+)